MSESRQRLTLTDLAGMKAAGDKIVCLTAYDASFAAVLDAAGVDVILVGDSLGNVIQGHDSTLPVTLDDMIYHTANVVRGARHALLVADMPFMSYATPEQALTNAARLLGEGGGQLVKMEGGAWLEETVSLLSERGIAVCAHLGLQPQSVNKLGGYRVQGRDAGAATRMFEDALALQQAGASMLVLECVPTTLAARISTALDIPVIGIGAGVECDGQVLVLYDLLGVTPEPRPRFVHDFLADASGIADAVGRYVSAVREGSFPAGKHSFE